MPDKQLTHKSIAVRKLTYEIVQEIANQLSEEKGVPVSMASAVHIIALDWQQNRTGQKGSR